MGQKIDLAVSWDTTGSMYPCLSQVVREVESFARSLFVEADDIQIGAFAHGDYCDAGSTYVIKMLQLTKDAVEVIDFVRSAGKTNGGDTPECYELVLRKARTEMKWRPDAIKCLVIIGDDVPHSPSYRQNTQRINWRDELNGLRDMGVHVYGVHAMPGIRQHSKPFYIDMARQTGGFYVVLDQFSYVTDVLTAIAYKQANPEDFAEFEQTLKEQGVDRNLQDAVSVMRQSSEEYFRHVDPTDTWDPDRAYEYVRRERPIRTGRDTSEGVRVAKEGLNPVPAGRFQVLKVHEDAEIRHFVEALGITFKPGRGFYSLTGGDRKKAVKVQQYKEVLIQNRETGDIFNGSEVREKLGLSPQIDGKGVIERLRPKDIEMYEVFIQSTSYNRKLLAGSTFMYEVEDWDRSS